ncbi:DUF6318 family protein [Jonesia quinghaiensis]|uniref:DUF6318 family protein n=1 Tax=Jonesia quinghaiensis TaxID=262806 RepID=UPI00146E2FF7|nr:DUF6318 family protein [Jonesia quinghaiensis]
MFFSLALNGAPVTVGRVVATALASILLLVGCVGAEGSSVPAPTTQVEEEPAPTEPAETDALEVVEPEERQVPEEPEAMKTGDKAGAIAAAKFFVGVIEYSMHTSNTDLLEEYSYENCGRCNHLIDLVEERVSTHQKSLGSFYTIEELNEPDFVGEGVLMWLVPVELSIEENLENSTDVVIQNPSLDFVVQFIDSRWILVEIETGS